MLAAALALVLAGVRTAAGRFGGSTVNEGSLFTSATVELDLGVGPDGGVGSASSSLSIDAENVLAGDTVERCIQVTAGGDLDTLDVRLLGRRDGGTGLDAFLLTDVTVGAGTNPDCSDFVTDRSVYDGTLAGLWDEPRGLRDRRADR